ncbi:MAG: TM2 domain-containing protein [Bacteroidetes bacterium]|nr:MAG: TM2 domain-containing protein [Bacteroidota bacterium]
MNRLPNTFLLLAYLPIHCYAGTTEHTCDKPDTSLACDTINVPDSTISIVITESPKGVLFSRADSSNISKFKFKKRIAALLAFPFPFGLLGLHRILLGTKPYIPFIYIGTLGGCFLILPVIDFIAILSADEEMFKKFENNPKVFMWPH